MQHKDYDEIRRINEEWGDEDDADLYVGEALCKILGNVYEFHRCLREDDDTLIFYDEPSWLTVDAQIAITCKRRGKHWWFIQADVVLCDCIKTDYVSREGVFVPTERRLYLSPYKLLELNKELSRRDQKRAKLINKGDINER